MSLIIYEVLKKYRYSERHGIPNDENTSFLLCDENKELEKNLEQAWNDKLDMMIWTFEQIINEEDEDDKFWKNEGTTKTYDFAAAKKHSIKVQDVCKVF